MSIWVFFVCIIVVTFHLQLPMLLAESSASLSSEVIQEIRAKIKIELFEYNLSHPTLHINLYDVRRIAL